MIKFDKPNYKVKEYIKGNNFGKFEISPLERGYGTTIGNALRRIMLSSLPGSAITSVKIDGVMHEFQKIEGIVEDVTAIVLALKSMVIINHSKDKKTLSLSSNKEGVVTAADFKKDADIEIINPDLVICNVVKGGKISLEVTIENGRGYVDAVENKKRAEEHAVGAIPMDSSFSPIELVKYEVEDTRVGQVENYDKLILEVTTNGSLKPEEAIALASKIAIEHFNILADINSISDIPEMMQEKPEDSREKLLTTPIEDLDFTVRAYNCLSRASIKTVGDLVEKTSTEVEEIRNLGKKSFKEVIDKIEELGLTFKE